MRVLPFRIAISKIENNMYLGSIEDAYDVKKLSSLGITHVLNMAIEIPNFYENQFTYKKINGRDIPSFMMNKHFDEVADFINDSMKNGKVFVHCFCGISRSTTALIAYMIKYRGIEPQKAYESIRKKRWIVYPNEGFMKQLNEYHKSKTTVLQENQNQLQNTIVKSNFTIKKLNPSKYKNMSYSFNDPLVIKRRSQIKSVNKENLLERNIIGGKSVPKKIRSVIKPSELKNVK